VRAKGIVPFFAAAAVVALLVPGATAAPVKPVRPAGRGTRPEVNEEFKLQGTGGYSITVHVENRRKLTLSATSFGKRGLALVEYGMPAPQAHGSDDIKARIGELGRIDVRFVPESVHETKSLPPDCRGGKTVTEEGRFVGLISFRGEGDFTRVRARSAPGSVATVPALHCPVPPRPPKKLEEEDSRAAESREAKERAENEVEEVQLLAKADGNGKKLEFEASRTSARERDGSKFSTATFAALAGRHIGRIEEASAVILLFEPGSKFLPSEPLEPAAGAVLKPGAPFSGTATFDRDAAPSARWSGDLKVALPGFGVVPLTSPATHASMCEGPDCPSL
jgi:hypothetical protein